MLTNGYRVPGGKKTRRASDCVFKVRLKDHTAHRLTFLFHSLVSGSCRDKKNCKVVFSQQELRKRLTPLQYHVTQEKGTESAFEGEYTRHKDPGIYKCVVCGAPLFKGNQRQYNNSLHVLNLFNSPDQQTKGRLLMSESRRGCQISDGCEPPCGCWEFNSGPLEEQPMLLTSEPSLQPTVSSFVMGLLSMCTRDNLFIGDSGGPLPSLQLDSWSSAWCLAVDLCVCFHHLLDEGSMMTIRVVINLMTGEGQF
ncbi:hypothetical protein STEG23_015831, partial [Scotinomys teguina]